MQNELYSFDRLYYQDKTQRQLLRSQGLWHVLIYLRHKALGRLDEPIHFLTSYELAAAAFDIVGVYLPISKNSRNCYFEPAATAGKDISAYYRHREGPRQTFLNRIQTGLSGQGPRQPHLFNVTSSSLPFECSLVGDWINVTRSYEGNVTLLDDRLDSILSWIFRFGVPLGSDGETTSFALHEGQGELSANPHVSTQLLPLNSDSLASCLCNFFGISKDQLDDLMPRLKHLEKNKISQKKYSFSELKGLLPSDQSSEYILDGFKKEGQDLALDWQILLQDALSSCPLTGVEQVVKQAISALSFGKYIILIGPPGTGKTSIAKSLAEAAIKNGVTKANVVTATSEWTTFETIGGYFPDVDTPDKLIFNKRLITQAIDENYWIIIDELNRADIDKAFGELFTLFTGEKVNTPFYTEDKKNIVLVPEGASYDSDKESAIELKNNWRLIGTMNTFDKSSLYQLSYAFMRRFAFINTPVPEAHDYQLIIDNCSQEIWSADSEQAEGLKDSVVQSLKKIFCDEVDGLYPAKIRLGPAIPIDCLKHYASLALLFPNEHTDINDTLLSVLDAYLFPQFEGMDFNHELIVESIATALNLSKEKRQILDQKLSIWTGHVSIQGK